jgi:hypothetical protein
MSDRPLRAAELLIHGPSLRPDACRGAGLMSSAAR